MPESKELHQKVDEILRHVQSMDGQMSWLIRSNDSGLRDLFIKYFADHSISAKVFLSIDGRKRVNKYLKN